MVDGLYNIHGPRGLCNSKIIQFKPSQCGNKWTISKKKVRGRTFPLMGHKNCVLSLKLFPC